MTAEPIGGVLRLLRPVETPEPLADATAELAEATLAIVQQLGHGPALAWLWLLKASSRESGIANITAAQLAADTSRRDQRQKSSRQAARDLGALFDAGLVGGTGPTDGRNGGWELRPLPPSTVISQLAGVPHAVRGDPQTELPLLDANETPNRDSVSRLLGGKGGATSIVPITSSFSALRSSDVRRLTSGNDDQEFEELTMTDVVLEQPWPNVVRRVKKIVNDVPKLRPNPSDPRDLNLLLKCSYLVETGHWAEFLLVNAVEGVAKGKAVRNPFAVFQTAMKERHPMRKDGYYRDLVSVFVPPEVEAAFCTRGQPTKRGGGF